MHLQYTNSIVDRGNQGQYIVICIIFITVFAKNIHYTIHSIIVKYSAVQNAENIEIIVWEKRIHH